MAQPIQRVAVANVACTTGEVRYVDFSRVFAALNRKHMDQVDSKGNAQVYLVKITQKPDDTDPDATLNCNVGSAPYTYVTQKAVKAWHKERKDMFERAGISMKSLSPYTRNLSMVLEDGSLTNFSNGLYTNTVEQSQLVNYSQVDDDDSTALTAANLADGFTLTLVGDHVVESTNPLKYTSVSCNLSWMEARRKNPHLQETATNAASDTIDHESSPLSLMRAGTAIAEEVLEVAEDEQYSMAPYSDTFQQNVMKQAMLTSGAGITDSCIVPFPCGLARLEFEEATSGSVNARFIFELIDVYDM